MENVSTRGPTFDDFVTILREGSIQDITIADFTVQEYRTYSLPSPPFIKCNVLRESLSEDSKNISCATLREGGR
jgi:hypothetical protein